MIELDEAESEGEYLRCTCLDRARLALEQTGQITCAGVMKELQSLVNDISKEYNLDSNKPLEVLLEALDECVMEDIGRKQC